MKTSQKLFIGLVTLAVIVVAFYLLLGTAGDSKPKPTSISSFEECVAAGYPVLDSYPEQCETPDGDRFVAFETPSDWKVQNTQEDDVTFMYPVDFGLDYVVAQDWPPQVQVLDESLECTTAGNVEDNAGQTEERMINNRDYCVTTIVEGAAGSIYTQYAYATEVDARTVILTFSVRAPQCANFGTDAEKEKCESDQHFTPDTLIDQIVSTLRFSE